MAADRSPRSKLARLQACAAELERALAHANRDLPAEYPEEANRQLATNLGELESSETADEQQVLVHARAKLRETRRILRMAAASPEETEFFALERAHDALFAEVDALLEDVAPARLVELSPPAGGGALVVRRDDPLVAAKLEALARRVSALETNSREVRQEIDTRRQVVALIYVERLRVNIDGLLKLALTFKAELIAKLVDLDWLAQLAKQVGKVAATLKNGIDATAKAMIQPAKLLIDVEQVRRLAERIAHGGRVLFHHIRRVLTRRERYSNFVVFRDVEAPWCPEMVAIPPSHFLMGSPSDEEGRTDDEGPQHEVRIVYRLALGRYPVTFAEYDAFCEATGRHKPHDEGWGRGRRPAIHVSWHEASNYCAWLAGQTGELYRLPSEAEWEFACRAGTTTPFYGDATISTEQANYDGRRTYGFGLAGEFRAQTVPVDEFAPNAFGLFQMHGNVWEWCEDIWHNDYVTAPADGSAWLAGGDGPSRVLRGGSWSNNPRSLRAANRLRNEPGNRNNDSGFRVAKVVTL